MEKIFVLAVLTIALLIYEIIKTKKENKILYNNYQTALKILSEYDLKLKEYLERENKI